VSDGLSASNSGILGTSPGRRTTVAPSDRTCLDVLVPTTFAGAAYALCSGGTLATLLAMII